MQKFLAGFVLTLGLCFLAGTSLFSQDRVERKDRKTDKSAILIGKIIEESPAGIKVKLTTGGKEEMISSSEIVRVTYADIPIPVLAELNKAAVQEEARNFAEALKMTEAAKAKPEFNTAPANGKRYIEFKIASYKAALADGEEKLREAAAALSTFVDGNSDSWEYTLAAPILARLQNDLGNTKGAINTLERLEKKSDVPQEIRSEASLALIDLSFTNGDYEAVAKRVSDILKDAKASASAKESVALYQLGLEGVKAPDVAALAPTIKKLEDIAGKSNNPAVKALAYNLMGDCYLAKGAKRDAMWSYLWVDVVYNQDRNEYLKALSRLTKYFKDVGDEANAKVYAEKLSRAR